MGQKVLYKMMVKPTSFQASKISRDDDGFCAGVVVVGGGSSLIASNDGKSHNVHAKE